MSVYEGNTSDTETLMPQVMKLKESFGLERMVLVGDRGMISKGDRGAQGHRRPRLDHRLEERPNPRPRRGRRAADGALR